MSLQNNPTKKWQRPVPRCARWWWWKGCTTRWWKGWLIPHPIHRIGAVWAKEWWNLAVRWWRSNDWQWSERSARYLSHKTQDRLRTWHHSKNRTAARYNKGVISWSETQSAAWMLTKRRFSFDEACLANCQIWKRKIRNRRPLLDHKEDLWNKRYFFSFFSL